MATHVCPSLGKFDVSPAVQCVSFFFKKNVRCGILDEALRGVHLQHDEADLHHYVAKGVKHSGSAMHYCTEFQPVRRVHAV